DRACSFWGAITHSVPLCRTTVCVSTVNVIIGWAVGIVGTGPEYGIPDEYISVSPERDVIFVRPEREGQEIAEKVGPKNWSGPTPQSSIPPAPPVRIDPLVPSGPTAQRPSGAQPASMCVADVRYLIARHPYARALYPMGIRSADVSPANS